MNETSYADIISSLALLIATGALAWNIIRDFVVDKVAIEFSVAFGELGNIKSSTTGLFADAGSLPNHQFDNPGMLVQITNIGRRPIGVASVGGELKNGQWLSMLVDGLPKMLQPYEIFSSIANTKQNFLERIQKDEIKDLWVTDTKGKKWLLSVKGWRRLKDTADYIVSKKNMYRG
ncbi:MAG: hypothetical protein A2648_01620 [Candidatus Lloydbacteria bacterium RIFCSPHIGHO2_01_FULL_41_20]|uniref:Uncharacterized protein n=1 Tax=Candidatus Lloydbacteria bacterium RIFCSPHIGHO2_01_FULL_41_20 TaxID=1798657 RepID=A0A1G2CRR7_9BACT|nr:MAG: hypothetical protein A3C73_02925 [Candidatus Giovannonibacteria bacterium RIFCSPHIGHO2_02_FULL_44_11]OGZ03947.1 MAG: hypothetical protein A2648_01620 [Candidatus Lloydbacteria bacterium RIFCSPHIGHO2_01_FULL_41_20]